MKEIRIILVDDHQIVIDGLMALIDSVPEFTIVAVANDGKQFLDMVQRVSADLVLMDVDMPEMNGIEATKLLKAQNSAIRVLVLTMHDEASLIKKLMEIGADGYMLKNADKEDLITAIKKVAAGQQFFSSEVTLKLLNTQKEKTDKKHSFSDVTERELEVLRCITEGLSNREIGEKLFISHRTVDTHRTNLMKKLEVKNIAGLVRIAIQEGLID